MHNSPSFIILSQTFFERLGIARATHLFIKAPYKQWHGHNNPYSMAISVMKYCDENHHRQPYLIPFGWFYCAISVYQLTDIPTLSTSYNPNALNTATQKKLILAGKLTEWTSNQVLQQAPNENNLNHYISYIGKFINDLATKY